MRKNSISCILGQSIFFWLQDNQFLVYVFRPYFLYELIIGWLYLMLLVHTLIMIYTCVNATLIRKEGLKT